MLSVALLDVNVLLALIWQEHPMRPRVIEWMANPAHEGWATCSVTQSGLVRVMCGPATASRFTPAEAIRALRLNIVRPTHTFWSDEMQVPDLLEPFASRLKGHQQITDAYLLAMRHKGHLATMDRGLLTLAQSAEEREAIRLI